jgi:hypothetical protein
MVQGWSWKRDFRSGSWFVERGQVLFDSTALRFAVKVVQAGNACHYWGQRTGNLGITGVGPMRFAVDDVFVDRGVKGLLHHGGSAGEFDHGSAFAHLCYLEAVRLQPGSHGLNVGVSGAELLAELLGCEPLVVVRRRFVLLFVKQTQEGGVLFRAALQNQQHPLHGLRRWSRAPVVTRKSERMGIAAQDRKAGVIDRLRDTRLDCRLLGEHTTGEQEKGDTEDCT